MLKLLSLASKTVGALTDEDLQTASSSIAGDGADGLFELFKTLRDAEPGSKVSDLLRTPSANALLQSAVAKFKAPATAEENGIFCRCPQCHFPFITE